jgi:hypothetical protein
MDTNTLSQIGRHRRASALFRECAVIPSEVMREAGGFPDIDALRNNMYPTTPRILTLMARVMATVDTSDTTLVDLYANLGAADPLVIACALDGRIEDSQYLDGPEWAIVTGDEAVRKKSQEFELTVLSNSEFAAIIDEAEE